MNFFIFGLVKKPPRADEKYKKSGAKEQKNAAKSAFDSNENVALEAILPCFFRLAKRSVKVHNGKRKPTAVR